MRNGAVSNWNVLRNNSNNVRSERQAEKYLFDSSREYTSCNRHRNYASIIDELYYIRHEKIAALKIDGSIASRGS